jgi:hypothetical protein
VGPRAGLDVCEKSHPHRDSITGPSSPQSVATPTELPGLRPDCILLDKKKSPDRHHNIVSGSEPVCVCVCVCVGEESRADSHTLMRLLSRNSNS